MLQASTPFAAFRDENDVVSTAKGGKGGGLGVGGGLAGQGKRGLVDSTPLKHAGGGAGLTNGVKSTRKALGDLSSSQVNTRLATPQHGGGAGATTAKKAQFGGNVVILAGLSSSIKQHGGGSGGGGISSKSQPVAAAEATVPAPAAAAEDGFDVADMLCSHLGKDEDAFDYVMGKAAKIKYTLSPPACTSVLDLEEAAGAAAADLSAGCWREQHADGDSLLLDDATLNYHEAPLVLPECELPLDD